MNAIPPTSVLPYSTASTHSAATNNAIEIEHLSKTWRVGFGMRKVQVVKDVSLSVREGEIYGFIGPNGAGKTTSIKILMGLAYPTSGEVRIFGKNAQEVAQKQQVGFLPERPYFYEYLTAREFLDFYGQLFGLKAQERRARTEKLLERVSLGAHGNTPLGRFSKGMLQRVGIAQALINDPRLVVLDEPMSGLDPLGRMIMRDLILELKQQGKTVFFSSHILSDVELICDRVGILVGGRCKDEGTLDELLAGRLKCIELVVKPRLEGLESLKAALVPLAQEVVRQGDRLMVRVADEARKREVLGLLPGHNAELEGLQARRESLEDLFLDELSEVKRTGTGG